jgi:beta-phosphoglucomutase-like phosphatase (HAD superfamily)
MEPLRRNLGLAGILPLFDPHVFSASQVARGKPHPDVFLFAASRMGAEASGCLVLEDSVPGVQAAVAAGMAVIGFVGAAHDPARIGNQLVEAGAREVIAHMDEWPGVVARMRGAPASDMPFSHPRR